MQIFRGKELPNSYLYIFIGTIVGTFINFVVIPNFDENLANLFILTFYILIGIAIYNILRGKTGLRHEIHLTDTQIIFARLGHGRVHRDFYNKETLLNISDIAITLKEEMPKLFYKLKDSSVKSFELKNWDEAHIDRFINFMHLTHSYIKTEKTDNISKLFAESAYLKETL